VTKQQPDTVTTHRDNHQHHCSIIATLTLCLSALHRVLRYLCIIITTVWQRLGTICRRISGHVRVWWCPADMVSYDIDTAVTQ